MEPDFEYGIGLNDCCGSEHSLIVTGSNAIESKSCCLKLDDLVRTIFSNQQSIG